MTSSREPFSIFSRSNPAIYEYKGNLTEPCPALHDEHVENAYSNMVSSNEFSGCEKAPPKRDLFRESAQLLGKSRSRS